MRPGRYLRNRHCHGRISNPPLQSCVLKEALGTREIKLPLCHLRREELKSGIHAEHCKSWLHLVGAAIGRPCRASGYKYKGSTHDKTAHPPSNAYHTRYPGSQLRNGALAAHAAIRLMLLGSPPDMVHGTALRKTESSTPLTRVRRYSTHPPSGIHPCCSGLQVTRHRYLPD